MNLFAFVLVSSESYSIYVLSMLGLEMFYLNSILNFVILPELVFKVVVYYKVDRLLTGLTTQQKGTTARWYSNKTSLYSIKVSLIICTEVASRIETYV